MSDLDFKGTWKTRSGDIATVRERQSNGQWVGSVVTKFNDNNDVTESSHTVWWDPYGTEVYGSTGFDLVENLSVKWANDRKGFKKGECE